MFMKALRRLLIFHSIAHLHQQQASPIIIPDREEEHPAVVEAASSIHPVAEAAMEEETVEVEVMGAMASNRAIEVKCTRLVRA